jgi:acetyl/propionyl-CoA carboxylase alpha subunit
LLLHFLTDEMKVAVEVNPDGQDWHLNIDGAEVPLQMDRDRAGAWLVDTHQGRRRLWVAVRGDERLVFCDGKVHTLRLQDGEHADDEEAVAGGPNLTADMPGKVVALKVAEGDEVAAGQTVIIMESMKMETELAAAVAGKVGRIHVTAGQVVGQGDALVDIEPAEDPD